jgi:hypothetical protein
VDAIGLPTKGATVDVKLTEAVIWEVGVMGNIGRSDGEIVAVDMTLVTVGLACMGNWVAADVAGVWVTLGATVSLGIMVVRLAARVGVDVVCQLNGSLRYR